MLIMVALGLRASWPYLNDAATESRNSRRFSAFESKLVFENVWRTSLSKDFASFCDALFRISEI